MVEADKYKNLVGVDKYPPLIVANTKKRIFQIKGARNGFALDGVLFW